MRFFILVALLLVPVANADVIINGTRYQTDEVRINFTEKGSEPAPVPEPQPTPPPSATGAGDCVMSSSQLCGSFKLSSPNPQLSGELHGTSQTISWKFSTTSDPALVGYFTVSESSGYGGVERKYWVSNEPGGAAVSSACSRQNISTLTIYWAQKSGTRGFSCVLETSKQYYLNLKNSAGCSSSKACGYYRNISSQKK